jgi:serine phosphatase RsbU (regulator of sigma subunit)/anti-sigma regulatory factor (Ser/Thr protein kinase)/PAS domain-containing protein
VADDRWDGAPCALLTLDRNGTVLEANRTLLGWLGRERRDVVGTVRLQDLLAVGGRIYWDTHLAPVLHVDGRFDEVALELVTPSGRLPVMMSAVGAPGPEGGSGLTHVAIHSAWERSRYEQELRAARVAAERSAGQSRALQHATAALSGALGVDGVATALLSAAVGPLGARAATLWLADPEGGLGDARTEGELGGSTPAPVTADVAQRRVARGEAGGSRVVVPLQGQSGLQGVLSLLPYDDMAADPLDLEVLTAVGLQAGLALDRAQLYEQSASVAHELQRSLLAIDPPADPRFAVATTYRPGVEMLEVGGDWYDAFCESDGILAVCVGDVVGRGLEAASAMGQLRSAVRAVAGPEAGPGRLLSRLDRFVEQVQAASMATLAYAELDLATGEFRYACAGHPPPLLIPAEGKPRLLWQGRSTPLGAFTRPQLRAEARVRLDEGDRVLLYTDGLIERRDRTLDVGLDLLSEAASVGGDRPLDEVVQELTRRLLRDEVTRDDVCVLLLSWHGSLFERQVGADLRTLSATRHALGSWLGGQGVDRSTRQDIVLAASEALANAAEHGAGAHPDEVVIVRARVDRLADGRAEVVVTVHDRGQWRTPDPSSERGRGLRIIAALVDDMLVRDEDGTTVVLRRAVKEGWS